MSRLTKLLALAVACCALLVPGSAGAATVVNGGFETGSLSGWQALNTTADGAWFAYFGNQTPFQKEDQEEEEEEIEECEEAAEGEPDPEPCPELDPETFFAPPSGNFAAVTEEVGPTTMVLYQDVALEPFSSHRLSAIYYYDSTTPMLVNPNTLEVGDEPGVNQQLRIDVIRPGASLLTLSPGDILATAFASKNTDPRAIAPTSVSADLSAFAGQTVRLRIVNAVNEGPMNTGVDDIAIASTPVPPSNAVKKGKLKLNKKKGTATLSVTVPGAGVLKLADAKKGKKKVLKPSTLTISSQGTVKVPVKPNGKGKKALKKKGKLQFRATLAFTPTGGTRATQKVSGKLKLNLPKAK